MKDTKFDQEMEDKWAKDLQDLNLDSQSDVEQNNFFEVQRLRLQQQLESLNSKSKKNSGKNIILQTLQNNNAIQSTLIQDFESQVLDLKQITKDQKSQPLKQETVKAIKQKVAAERSNLSFAFTDQNIDKIETQKRKEKQRKQNNGQNQGDIDMTASNFMKKKKAVKQFDLLNQKLEKAAVEREILMMGREEQFSMKYQLFCQSQFFSQRFITPKLRIVRQQNTTVVTKVTAPKSSFTNLRPMPNKQYNVLPKNAPQIALKKIKRAKKLILVPDSKKLINLSTKKIYSCFQQQECSNRRKVESEIGIINANASIDPIQEKLKSYVKKICPIFQFIQKTMKNYNPRFIKKFLDLQQKASNIEISSASEGQQKSIQAFIAEDQHSLGKLKQLTVTFQSITSLKGIQHYANIQLVALQYNSLKSLNLLGKCQKLIQVNVSYNKLKQANEGLKNLRWLKFFSAEHNLLRQIDFSGCESLQICELNNNNIEVVKNGGNNMKILNLSYNNLSQLSGLQNCHLLEQLNLRKNFIKSFEGLQQCILLRKLDASNNRLGNDKDFKQRQIIYLFLNQLVVNNNYITDLPLLFLPSLEKLYLENNKLKEVPLVKKGQIPNFIYLPNLKILNLDNNALEGFSYVWFLLRYSQNLEILKYDDNQCFLNLRDQARALYQSIIYKNMKGIKILNQNPAQLGLKKFYQSAYRAYLDNFSMFSQKSDMLQNLEKKIDFILKQQRAISQIDKMQIKFCQQKVFIQYKSIQLANSLFQIANFVNPQQINYATKKTEQEQYKLFEIKKSIFYQHDQYQIRMRASYHKIRSMIVRFQYRKKKRMRHYQKNGVSIWRCFQKIYALKQKLKLKDAFDNLHALTMRFTKQEAAIYIQKIWRGYRMRKRYLKIIKKFRVKQQEQFDDMPEFDQSYFDRYGQSHQPRFDIPDQLNFQDYIIKPQIFTILDQQQSKAEQKYRQKQKKQQQKQPMINNFFDDPSQTKNIQSMNNFSSISQKKKKQQEQDQKLMKQWGFKDKASLEGFKLKRRKKQQQKRKQRDKNMTAQQRLQKFKKNH